MVWQLRDHQQHFLKIYFFTGLGKEARLQGNKVNGVEMGGTESPTDHSKKWSLGNLSAG